MYIYFNLDFLFCASCFVYPSASGLDFFFAPHPKKKLLYPESFDCLTHHPPPPHSVFVFYNSVLHDALRIWMLLSCSYDVLPASSGKVQGDVGIIFGRIAGSSTNPSTYVECSLGPTTQPAPLSDSR